MYVGSEQVFRIAGRNIYFRIHRNIIFHSESLVKELASFRTAVWWLVFMDVRDISGNRTDSQVQFEWMDEREIHGYRLNSE